MLWEVGILLVGIGILILCIFAATTLKDLSSAIKTAERLLEKKNSEIESIIDSTSGIMGDVEVLTNRVNNLTNISSIVSGISNILKKEDLEEEIEDFEEEDINEE